MPGAQPEECCSSRVTTKQMPRLDVLLLLGRVGGGPQTMQMVEARTCDSTHVRLHVEILCDTCHRDNCDTVSCVASHRDNCDTHYFAIQVTMTLCII